VLKDIKKINKEDRLKIKSAIEELKNFSNITNIKYLKDI